MANLLTANSTGITSNADGSNTLQIQTGSTTAIAIDASQNVTLTNALPVSSGGTGATTSTGSGAVVLATSPTLTTPALGTPSSGTLSSCTVDGTNKIGYLGIPQNAQGTSYTLLLSDAGKQIYNASGSGVTYTIPANASVAFPIGTAVSFVNLSSSSVTIAITSDTMYLANAGSTGNRTLAQYGIATATKITATSWIIAGVALT